ncbi:MAG: hypothetical protein C4548_02080 [Desulfobacteraceae bacterium]|jgi:hypothetical protein|nr:MAG: hypothetical protein C4548_02080 [Desulfobacteraceae bacterium]
MNLQPQGEDLRKAVKWISEMLQTGCDETKMALIEKASLNYDLKPADQEFLMRFFCKKTD